MSTKDRILDVSLDLFNEEGVIDATAVDIANALGISPGNLYYHYRGKDAIVSALFDRFEDEILMILANAKDTVQTVEDLWVYNYIILEEIFDFRFFYRDLGAMVIRYPALGRRFRGILRSKRNTISILLDGLETRNIVSIDARLRPVLEEELLRLLTLWLTMEEIQDAERFHGMRGGALMHRTVYQLMAAVVPHMGRLGPVVLDRMARFYARQVGTNPD